MARDILCGENFGIFTRDRKEIEIEGASGDSTYITGRRRGTALPCPYNFGLERVTVSVERLVFVAPSRQRFSAVISRTENYRRDVGATKASYLMDWSTSRIQSFDFKTSRGLVPSGGPTMPSFSMMSMRRAARP